MVSILYLIPLLPLLAAGILAVTPLAWRRFASGLSIGAMALGFVLFCFAFVPTLGHQGNAVHTISNFTWFQFGEATVKLGWVLDPLPACMLMMVTFVGTLI